MSETTTNNQSDAYVILKILNVALLCLILIDKSIENNPKHIQGQQNSYELKLTKQADFQSAEETYDENLEYKENIEQEIPIISEKYIAKKTEKKDKKTKEENLVNVYYIKKAENSIKNQTYLVKINKKSGKKLKEKIKTVLDSLVKGPTSKHRKHGVRTSMPMNLSYHKKVRFSKGIVHISFSRELGEDADINTLKDRIDQLTYSLLSIKKIKGIKLYINYIPVRTIGSEKFPIPSVLTKRTRKVIVL